MTISGDDAKVETIKQFAGPTGVTLTGETIWVSEGQLDYLSNPDKKGSMPPFELRSISIDKTTTANYRLAH
jgi:hypothetical protein